MLQTLFSEVLTRTDWLTVWDNIFSNHPSFMLYFLVAYLIHSRKALLCTRTKDNIKVYWFLYLFIYTGRPLQFWWAICNEGLTFLAKPYKGACRSSYLFAIFITKGLTGNWTPDPFRPELYTSQSHSIHERVVTDFSKNFLLFYHSFLVFLLFVSEKSRLD